MPKIKNIIIFFVIGMVLIVAYLLLFKKSEPIPDLITSIDLNTNTVDSNGEVVSLDTTISEQFLADLLGIRNIHLEDNIFFDPAFMALKDPDVVLIPEGNEGRPNPFAPIGTDINASVVNTIPNTNTTTPSTTEVKPTNTTTTPTSTSTTPPANGGNTNPTSSGAGTSQ